MLDRWQSAPPQEAFLPALVIGCAAAAGVRAIAGGGGGYRAGETHTIVPADGGGGTGARQ